MGEQEESGGIGIPYVPQEQLLQQEAFRQELAASGRSLIRHRPLATDPLVLRQRWLVTPQGTPYDAQAFYRAFDHETFRQTLRVLLAQPLLSVTELASLTEEHLQFLEEQEFLRKAPSWNTEREDHAGSFSLHFKNAIWERGVAGQGISNLGRTLEWYVAEWFRSVYQTHACHGVETRELTIPGDLDVVALKNGKCFFVECKSSSQIEEQKLRLLLQRSSALCPDMTLLLIDAASATSIELRTRQLCQLLEQPYDPSRRQIFGKTVFHWVAAQNLYVANTGAGIAATLVAVMRFHEALTRVRLYR